MRELSNVEVVLLELIAENEEISGYEINQLIIERGFREWADIGTTAIYVGLKKIEEKKLVESFIDLNKEGKGPVPKKYRINEEGLKSLKEEIRNRIETSPDRGRFEIGMAGMPLLKPEEVIQSLEKRILFLEKRINYLKERYQVQGGDKLPLHVRALFDHPDVLTNLEMEFAKNLLHKYKKEYKNGKN
jgi:DNA-binding PadR family transcriptional regulator